MKKNAILSTCVLLLTTLLFSCQKETSRNMSEHTKEKIPDEYLNTFNLLKNEKGIPAASISYEAQTKEFIAGDMVFTAALYNNIMYTQQHPKTEQQWNNVFVSYASSQHILYYLDPSLFPYYYFGPLEWAVWYWNGSSPNISFTRTGDRSAANLIVDSYNDPTDSSWIRTTLPAGNGNVGNRIRLNLGVNERNHYVNHITSSNEEKLLLMMHALGHTLGYLHADQYAGLLIPGTPDPAFHQANACGSVMRSVTYVCGWGYDGIKRWSPSDITAIQWGYRYKY
ncbi:hypothetical protein CLV51_103347 [Chitinophaga niastensis]|uniref:Dual-action HEIGH metallo-peptidase n=1 Tax=Chitinophaga niastensis TaxID=536980 RepID=A0A2P8HJI3_CHINA|nr:hypothetical protein [Chitinophaga niastensis]PSL46369.1 hypothetical protein CLV51_103347 [Chitinophaga niastensis]